MLEKEGPGGDPDSGAGGGDKDKEPPGPKVDLSLKQGEKIKISIGGGSKVSTWGVGWMVVGLVLWWRRVLPTPFDPLFPPPSPTLFPLVFCFATCHGRELRKADRGCDPSSDLLRK